MSIDGNVSRMSGVIVALEFAALFIVSILARSAFLDHEPIHDELYHLLAARSWVENGSFAIADGEYTRSRLYTVFVGSIYQLFGDDVTAVRWSSAIVGSVWVLAIFAWCRYRFDRKVAWITALLFSLAPGSIFLSQYIRFYVLHGLLFWLFAVAVFEFLEKGMSPWSRALLLCGLVLCFATASHLQLTTLVGAAGIGLYAAARTLPVIIEKWPTSAGLRRTLVGLALICSVGLVGLFYSGIAAEIVAIYRWAPAWASNSGFLRYHWMLVEQYPLIWGLLPVAVFIAMYNRSLAGFYCASVFLTAIVLHSFAGMKAERFIFYVMPFFFVLGAILVKEGLKLADKLVAEIVQIVQVRSHWLRGGLRVGLVSIACIFMLLSNPAYRATADMLRGRPVTDGGGEETYWSRYDTAWSQAASRLQSLVAESEVVLTASELHMLYFAGRVDIELNSSRLSDLVEPPWHQDQEFTLDFRTGRPVISSPESMSQIFSCYRSGLIVVRADIWTRPVFIPTETRVLIESMTEQVDIPTQWGLRVQKWERDNLYASPECDRFQEPRSANTMGTMRPHPND